MRWVFCVWEEETTEGKGSFISSNQGHMPPALLSTVDTNLAPLAEVLFARFLDSKVTLPHFSHCILWKEVTQHSPCPRNEEHWFLDCRVSVEMIWSCWHRTLVNSSPFMCVCHYVCMCILIHPIIYSCQCGYLFYTLGYISQYYFIHFVAQIIPILSVGLEQAHMEGVPRPSLR